MLTFEREIGALLPADLAAPLIARERRDVVSVYTEVRALAWIGVMLIATGVGIIVSKNLERIGPIAIAATIGVAAAACYAYAGVRWQRHRFGTLDDYILLLGALLLSADLGYIEDQWHLLGTEWPRHFLVLAVVHGATAYFFQSGMLLSLSIAAFASWLGIDRHLDTLFTGKTDMAIRAFVCAGVVGVWRLTNRRREFDRIFDHFIANFALWGGLILSFEHDTLYLGAAIVITIAVLTILHGFRKREELFLLYAYVYGVIAVDVVAGDNIHDQKAMALYIVISTMFAIAGLFGLHGRFRRARA
jgi:hypothetical protein